MEDFPEVEQGAFNEDAPVVGFESPRFSQSAMNSAQVVAERIQRPRIVESLDHGF